MKIKLFEKRWADVRSKVLRVAVEVGNGSDLGSQEAHARVTEILAEGGLEVFPDPPMTFLDSHAVTTKERLAWWREAAKYSSVTKSGVEVESVNRGVTTLLRINAPEWYKDPEFRRWLAEPGVATWHIGGDPNEYSDAFFTFNQGDGSDAPALHRGGVTGIPPNIWAHLSFVVAATYGWDAEVLVWVSNLN